MIIRAELWKYERLGLGEKNGEREREREKRFRV